MKPKSKSISKTHNKLHKDKPPGQSEELLEDPDSVPPEDPTGAHSKKGKGKKNNNKKTTKRKSLLDVPGTNVENISSRNSKFEELEDPPNISKPLPHPPPLPLPPVIPPPILHNNAPNPSKPTPDFKRVSPEITTPAMTTVHFEPPKPNQTREIPLSSGAQKGAADPLVLGVAEKPSNRVVIIEKVQPDDTFDDDEDFDEDDLEGYNYLEIRTEAPVFPLRTQILIWAVIGTLLVMILASIFLMGYYSSYHWSRPQPILRGSSNQAGAAHRHTKQGDALEKKHKERLKHHKQHQDQE